MRCNKHALRRRLEINTQCPKKILDVIEVTSAKPAVSEEGDIKSIYVSDRFPQPHSMILTFFHPQTLPPTFLQVSKRSDTSSHTLGMDGGMFVFRGERGVNGWGKVCSIISPTLFKNRSYSITLIVFFITASL